MKKLLFDAAKTLYKKTPSPAIRAFWFNTFCRMVRNRKILKTVGGISYNLDLGEVIDLSTYLDHYEIDVRKAIERYCHLGMTIFDVGANIGSHALRLASIVGEKGQVYAFEPTEFAYEKLCRNITLNPFLKITAYRIALSDANSTGQTVNFRSSWRTDGSRRDWQCSVDFVKLDSWAKENRVENVDLIKMDVDGNEYSVFDGGKEIISRSRPIILMEVVGPHLASEERNPVLWLEKKGYYFLHARTLEKIAESDLLRVLSPDDNEMTNSVNIIALPDEQLP